MTSDFSFLYDGWNMVCEQITGNGAPATNYYFYGLDLSGSLQGAGGIGGLIARVSYSGGTTCTWLYAADANGNITDVIEASTSNTVAHYEYDAYGNLIYATGSALRDNPYRFSTKYFDEETGLYYYGYRYYSPKLGRFLSRDPIGEHTSFNLYQGLRNNPIKYVDPDGRDPKYWPPDEGPKGTNNVFAICSRDLKPCGVIEGVVYSVINRMGGEHTYIQYGCCDCCEGWGFGGGKKGSLPKCELYFHPTDCTICKKSDNKLENGQGKGKKGSEASDQEIVDCIKNTPASKDYDPNPKGGMYVCKDWANEATKKCGLDCSK
jgi:RHS repeat-associated protein